MVQFIPARQRFSTNASSQNIRPGILREAVQRFGRSPERTEFRRLPGGFMNGNFLVTVGEERFVLRVYLSVIRSLFELVF